MSIILTIFLLALSIHHHYTIINSVNHQHSPSKKSIISSSPYVTSTRLSNSINNVWTWHWNRSVVTLYVRLSSLVTRSLIFTNMEKNLNPRYLSISVSPFLMTYFILSYFWFLPKLARVTTRPGKLLKIKDSSRIGFSSGKAL